MSRAERPPRLRSASTSSDQLSLGRGEALTATRTATRLHRAYECAPHDVAALTAVRTAACGSPRDLVRLPAT